MRTHLHTDRASRPAPDELAALRAEVDAAVAAYGSIPCGDDAHASQTIIVAWMFKQGSDVAERYVRRRMAHSLTLVTADPYGQGSRADAAAAIAAHEALETLRGES